MNLETEMRLMLGDLGLTGPEIAVYLAALEAGSASAAELGEAAGMNRVTAYEVLKRLSRKGFVKIRAKKNQRGRYFVPMEYHEIVERLQEKRIGFDRRLARIESLKTEFQAKFSRAEAKPVTLFYEGVAGIKTVLEDTLHADAKEILSFASVESLGESFDQNFLEAYWQKRVAKGMVTRGIVPKTDEAVRQFPEARNRAELRQLRFLSPELYDFANEIDIYGDNVGITSLTKGGEHGVIIRSRSIAQSLRSVFEALWVMSAKKENF
jgi:sugar-specific transcriptional regulator TrmB